MVYINILSNHPLVNISDAYIHQVSKLILLQGKLNEIWVVVPLEMKQLDFQDVINPEDIPSAKGLVVPNKTIARLNTRIEELMVERYDS